MSDDSLTDFIAKHKWRSGNVLWGIATIITLATLASLPIGGLPVLAGLSVLAVAGIVSAVVFALYNAACIIGSLRSKDDGRKSLSEPEGEGWPTNTGTSGLSSIPDHPNEFQVKQSQENRENQTEQEKNVYIVINIPDDPPQSLLSIFFNPSWSYMERLKHFVKTTPEGTGPMLGLDLEKENWKVFLDLDKAKSALRMGATTKVIVEIQERNGTPLTCRVVAAAFYPEKVNSIREVGDVNEKEVHTYGDNDADTAKLDGLLLKAVGVAVNLRESLIPSLPTSNPL